MKKIILALLGFGVCTLAHAQIKLPRLISDGMVLQRETPLLCWGWASPGEKVSVQFLGKSYHAITDGKGKWQTLIPPQKSGGPYSISFTASNSITLNNILIGDVWVCSGQSNMELPLERVKEKYAAEIAVTNAPFIRQFTVPDQANFQKEADDFSGGRWLAATPENILSFSAAAFFFAKEIHDRYKIPIGLINAALGGSPAEAWISERSLQQFPSYYQEAIKFRDSNLIRSIENTDNENAKKWQSQLDAKDEGLLQQWAKPGFNDSEWNNMNIPGYWADTKTGPVNGAVWFRKQIEVPPAMTGLPARLEMGRIVDADQVYINNQLAGTTGYQYPPRRYMIPANLLKPGINTIVVRVISQSGRGGFVLDKPYTLSTPKDTIDLKGPWQYKTGAIMPAQPGRTFINWKPMGLYNAMIAPLKNYPVKGVLWYQGESNAGRPDDYAALMEALIRDWRQQWKQAALPFIYVQLANFMEPSAIPQESSWAALRQQQWKNLSIAHTGMVVAIDCGEWNDIHPENKKDIGTRLALQARKIAYGEQKLTASGPLYQRMEQKGRKLVLHFTNTGSGLVTRDGKPLQQFAIAGVDRKYVWASALIKGNTIEVWSDAIDNPVAVRYAWANNPAGANLYNKEGLPASPFSTE